MEPRDPLDDLISETLRDRLGPGPSPEVWQRISREIAPARRSPWSRLRLVARNPLVQSVAMVVALFALLAQPALYWQHSRPLEGPAMLPTATYGRPLPEADLPVRDIAALRDDQQPAPERLLTAQ